MAVVAYFEFYCRYGTYLLINRDIKISNCLVDRNYIFVSDRDVSVDEFKGTILQCCYSSLGVICYIGGEKFVKFVRHHIERKKIRLCIQRLIDQDRRIVGYENTIVEKYECFGLKLYGLRNEKKSSINDNNLYFLFQLVRWRNIPNAMDE